MKIILTFWFVFISLVSGYTQSELPESISVVHYIGGDYRGKDLKGAYDNKDSIVFTRNLATKKYESYESYHVYKILPYLDRNFRKNINKDSTITTLGNNRALFKLSGKAKG